MSYVLDAARGNLGRSILSNRPVASELAVRFPATLELTVAAMLVGLLVGVPLGTLAATRRGSATDALTMTISLFGLSMPVFWLGLVLIGSLPLELGMAARLGAAQGGSGPA